MWRCFLKWMSVLYVDECPLCAFMSVLCVDECPLCGWVSFMCIQECPLCGWVSFVWMSVLYVDECPLCGWMPSMCIHDCPLCGWVSSMYIHDCPLCGWVSSMCIHDCPLCGWVSSMCIHDCPLCGWVSSMCIHDCPLCGWVSSMWMSVLYVDECPLCGWVSPMWMSVLYVDECPLCEWVSSMWMSVLYVDECPLCAFMSVLNVDECPLCGWVSSMWSNLYTLCVLMYSKKYYRHIYIYAYRLLCGCLCYKFPLSKWILYMHVSVIYMDVGNLVDGSMFSKFSWVSYNLCEIDPFRWKTLDYVDECNLRGVSMFILYFPQWEVKKNIFIISRKNISYCWVPYLGSRKKDSLRGEKVWGLWIKTDIWHAYRWNMYAQLWNTVQIPYQFLVYGCPKIATVAFLQLFISHKLQCAMGYPKQTRHKSLVEVKSWLFK